MDGNAFELVVTRMRRARARGSLREAWRHAVTLTVRDERDPRWWVHRASLAAQIGRDDDLRTALRQAMYLFHREGRAGCAAALSMWLRRKEIETHRAHRTN